jgi:putative salt-induced outer membrane protein YdiY
MFLPLCFRRLSIAALLALFSSAVPLHGDTVVLKNGDKLTGTAVKLDSGKLTFKTPYADAIVISWDQVINLTVTEPMVLPMPKGNLTVTTIERTDAGLVVTTPAGTSTFPAAEVTVLRDKADQATYEASLHPNWTHAWAGAVNVNLALARGNSNASTFGVGFTALRPTPTDKTSVYFNTLYSTNGNAVPTTSANTTAGGLRYDHNLNPKVFLYGSGDFYSDALQELDLRSILGGGGGWHAIKSPRQTFDVLAGLVWTRESYSATAAATGTTNSFPALDFSEQYSRKIGAASQLAEQFSIYPDLSTLSRYQFTMNTTFTTKLGKTLSWATTFSDNYTSFPPTGTLANDLILSTGLGITLARP